MLIEASHFLIKAGTQWLPAGYSGSFAIDPRSLEIERFAMESDELPPTTSLCEVSTTNEYQGDNPMGLLLPSVSRSHDILRDATETAQVTTFSNCSDSAARPSPPETITDLALPKQAFGLALSTPIDTATAAAGDIISASLTEPILRSKFSAVLAPAGSIVTGRIVRMEHRLRPRNNFVVSLAFDRVEVEGKYFRLRIKSDDNRAATIPEWPMGTFSFPASNSRYVIPAGFKSKWLTVPLAQPVEAPPHSR